MQYYFKPVRELPTGRGFADFIYIPKSEYRAYYPVSLFLRIDFSFFLNYNKEKEKRKKKKGEQDADI